MKTRIKNICLKIGIPIMCLIFAVYYYHYQKYHHLYMATVIADYIVHNKDTPCYGENKSSCVVLMQRVSTKEMKKSFKCQPVRKTSTEFEYRCNGKELIVSYVKPSQDDLKGYYRVTGYRIESFKLKNPPIQDVPVIDIIQPYEVAEKIYARALKDINFTHSSVVLFTNYPRLELSGMQWEPNISAEKEMITNHYGKYGGPYIIELYRGDKK